MLELATLGALVGGPLHGYALKAWLERYMGSVITVNFGAIYPLLRRLREQRLISAKPARSEGKQVTLYSITAAGRKRFRAEMLAFPSESRVNARSRFLTKAYFFDYVTPTDRAAILTHRAEMLSSSVFADLQAEPQFPYRGELLAFAQAQLETETAWVKRMLKAESRAGRKGVPHG